MRKWLTVWKKYRDDVRKKRTLKSLREKIEDLEIVVRSKDAEIEHLRYQLEGARESLKISESTIKIHEFEIDNLNQVIVRDRKRVEAESQIANRKAERELE